MSTTPDKKEHNPMKTKREIAEDARLARAAERTKLVAEARRKAEAARAALRADREGVVGS